MSVSFFKDSCKSESSAKQIGICDDPAPSNNPAYLDEENTKRWVGKVNNINLKLIEFYAIDHCVNLLKPDGKMQRRCDGLLKVESNLIFIELKSRDAPTRKWLKEGREQLTETINRFRVEHDISSFDKIEAYVCNNVKPLAASGHAVNIQKFKDDTGLILRGQQEILID